MNSYPTMTSDGLLSPASLNTFLRDLERQATPVKQSIRLTEPYRRDIVAFVHDILGVAEIRPYQEQALSALLEHRRVCMRGPHGIGKTALEAWAVLWALAVHEEIKAPTTASAWRQLTEYLWP